MSRERLECGGICTLRPWRLDDASSLVRHANNRKIWMNVRDRFPNPYTEKDAEEWLAKATTKEKSSTDLAIEVDGEAAGGIGVILGTDVERVSAEIGYWLGEEVWGRGVATAAVSRFSEYAFRQFSLSRLAAFVFATNQASIRVLEKAGFEREGVMRRSAIKNGVLVDQVLYSKLNPSMIDGSEKQIGQPGVGR